jgi:NAD(P)-dependent dehydrogenase (short-subunit alcohol dehydrogenase family)
MSNPVTLEGRVAVVTGAGGAIGSAAARALAEHGGKVVVCELDAGLAARTVAALRADGLDAVASIRDISVPDACAAVVDDTLAAFGRIDVLIHNAGILRDSDLGGITDVDWRHVLAVNLDAPLWLTRAAWPALCRQEYGRLVFITSASGIFGNIGHAHYTASKAGLVGLMKAVALEGADHGIMANAVAPLAVTKMSHAPVTAGSSRVGSREIVGPHFEQFKPEQVAALVTLLGSERCPQSGAVFASAGGYTREIMVSESHGADFGSASPTEMADRWTDVSGGPTATPRSLREDMVLLRELLDNARGAR